MSATGVNGPRDADGGHTHDERGGNGWPGADSDRKWVDGIPVNGTRHYDRVRLGAVIRSHRQSAQLSQEELAHRSGLSVRSVRNLEVGAVARPHADTIRRLGRALGLDADQAGRLESIARPEREPAGPEAGSGPADRDWAAIRQRLRTLLANLPADQSTGNVILLPVVVCCDYHAAVACDS
jgi:transcriptional regulator with XRE-family HTH domain